MMTVDEAIACIRSTAAPLAAETISLWQAPGRVLASAVSATVDHPASALSAMDGYAVRWAPDCLSGATLRVIGNAPAGTPFAGTVEPGEAVRVFTGSVVPQGCDHIIIQEDVERQGDGLTLTADQPERRYIRPMGGDFGRGDHLAVPGTVITPSLAGLLAAANIAKVPVTRRPRIAVIANGDELLPPGSSLPAGGTVNSAPYALIPLLQSFGADAAFIGIAPDTERGIAALFDQAAGHNIIVPVGGASVGDHDHMKAVGRQRFTVQFDKVAVKPGKPAWYGTSASGYVLGLPGNPASALTCAHLFVRPLIDSLLGSTVRSNPLVKATLEAPLSPNGRREQYLRGICRFEDDGSLSVQVAPQQDSSLLRPYAAANALVKRAAGAPASAAGSLVDLLLIGAVR